MKLTFYGATRTVTGSCHFLEANGKNILVDCGLFQEKGRVDNNERLFFDPKKIDLIIVTHAHIDHSGRIPLLIKHGFSGRIYATGMTCKLLDIMLRDSAYIQESEAEWANRKGKRAGKEHAEPLYTMQNAEKALEYLVPCNYNEIYDISEGLTLRFTDAGHLLGSGSAEIWADSPEGKKKIVFSGDIGNINQPIIRDPQFIQEADYVVMESTYGDEEHRDNVNYIEELAEIIRDTLSRGGNVVIPAFAVGRTQEILYFIRQIKERGLIKHDFPVYIDSPLANEATKIFSGDLTGYLDDESLQDIAAGKNILQFNDLRLCLSAEDSKALNENPEPKVIISASGMCEAGRVRHHLKHNLWRQESTIVFVGFQVQGSLGRLLLDGASSVKLFGEEIVVRAKIINLLGMSAHADRKMLIRWISGFDPHPRHVFVVHGNPEAAEAFSNTLGDMGFFAHAPEFRETYDLERNMMLQQGVPMPTRKQPDKESAPFRRLVEVGEQLMAEIIRSKGRSNRDLGKMKDQIRAMLTKWER